MAEALSPTALPDEDMNPDRPRLWPTDLLIDLLDDPANRGAGADLCRALGWPRFTISRVKTFRRRVTQHEAEAISRHLATPVEDLFTGRKPFMLRSQNATPPTPENPYPEVDRLDHLLNPHEVAAFLRVSESYVYRLIKNGSLRKLPIGNPVLIPREEVRRLFTAD